MNEKHNYIAEPFSQVADDHRCVECGEQPDHPSHRAISQPASETPETDALFGDCFGPEEDWTPNQKRCAVLARDLEQRLHAAEAEHKRLKGELDKAALSTHHQAHCIHQCAAHIGPDTSATIEGLPRAVARLRSERDAALARCAKLEGALGNRHTFHWRVGPEGPDRVHDKNCQARKDLQP